MSHPLYKLGRLKPRIDKRTLKLATILRRGLKQLPPEYSFDTKYPGIPLPMFANDQYGDCVIAGRAHQTLRFEFMEQNKVIKITDKDVLNEYFKETGGSDSGLVMLDSLNAWRKGWKVSSKTYKIKAYAAIPPAAKDSIQQTIFSDVGCYVAIDLPLSAQKEFDAGKPWAKTTGPGTTIGSWGGHCVYVVGYTTTGPTCITWGQRQQMTWTWFKKYCVEAYAVIDALNSTKKKQLFNEKAINEFLSSL